MSGDLALAVLAACAVVVGAVSLSSGWMAASLAAWITAGGVLIGAWRRAAATAAGRRARIAQLETRLESLEASWRASEVVAAHGKALGNLAAKLVRRRFAGRLGIEVVNSLASALEVPAVALVRSGHGIQVEHAVGFDEPAADAAPLSLPEEYTAPSAPMSIDGAGPIAQMLGGLRPERTIDHLLVAPVPVRLGRLVLVIGRDAPFGEADVELLRTVANMLGAAKSRELVEVELRQAQKLEAVGLVAGSVAHDFNNLLTTILSGTELAALRSGAESEPARVLADVKRAAEHAAVLTRQLLSFSRTSAAEAAVHDLGVVLEELEGLLNRIAGDEVELRIETTNATVPVFADRTNLEQLLFNLVSNARDAIEGSGTIVIRARRAPYSSPALAELVVADNGRGMEPEVLERSFEPFFTTKEDGTGLGLPTVRRVVSELQGSLDVDSEVGEGTTFTIRFPMALDAGAVPLAASQRKLSILLVDDNEMARRALSALLAEAGHRVEEAEDGADALEVVDRGLEVDVVVADVVMPRVSGAALVAELRRRKCEIPVVLMTGYADSELDQNVLSQAAGLLYKPFRLEDLENLLHHVASAELASVES
jgi:signal transduction histidine kinase/ActR/RegA family two-component response regulator